MRKILGTLCALLAWCGSAGAAGTDTFFMLNGYGSKVYQMSISTLSLTPIADLNILAGGISRGIAYRQRDGLLYGTYATTNGLDIWTVDPVTGAIATKGIAINPSTIGVIQGLAYDNVNDVLYSNGQKLGHSLLYTLDPSAPDGAPSLKMDLNFRTHSLSNSTKTNGLYSAVQGTGSGQGAVNYLGLPPTDWTSVGFTFTNLDGLFWGAASLNPQPTYAWSYNSTTFVTTWYTWDLSTGNVSTLGSSNNTACFGVTFRQ